MKHFLYGAVSLCALGLAMPQLQAGTVSFTLSSGGAFSNSNQVLTYTSSGFTLVLTGYDCGNVTLCSSVPTQDDSTTALKRTSDGLGLANDRQGSVYEIPRDEFIQVAFTVVPGNATISSIQFNMKDVVDGWDIYQSGKAGELDSTSAAAVAQGNNQTGYTLAQFANINSTISKNATTGFSLLTTSSPEYFNVTALQADCETLLSSIVVNYSTSDGTGTTQSVTPEPATCALLGGALIALGVMLRKKRGSGFSLPL